MGGRSVSSGAEHQAGITAYIAVRILLEERLNWVPPSEDIPTAVAGEQGGPGDDILIEFGNRRPQITVQCKRSVSGRSALAVAIRDITDRFLEPETVGEVVLAVGPGSTPEVRDTFAADVRKFRQGRTDLQSVTLHVLDKVEHAGATLRRLSVVTLDVDTDAASGAQVAIGGLRRALEEPSRAEAAWSLLVREALTLGRGGRWDRSAVVALLKMGGFPIRPLGADSRSAEQIQDARRLAETSHMPKTALGVLESIERSLRGVSVSADVRRQLHTALGVALLLGQEYERAVLHMARAVEFTLPPANEAEEAGMTTLAANERRSHWLNTRYNYAYALFPAGQADEAEEIVQTVLEADPSHAAAWALRAQLLRARGAIPPDPPIGIGTSAVYQEGLAEAAFRDGDWEGAIRTSADLLATGGRTPARLFMRATALINASTEIARATERERMLEEAERNADEAVGILETGDPTGMFARALFTRGLARERIGRAPEGEADIQRAADLIPDDPNIVRRAAVLRLSVGDVDGALALLSDERIGDTALLLILRASVHANAARPAEARSDLARARQTLPVKPTAADLEAFESFADVAIELGDLDLALDSLDDLDLAGVPERGPNRSVLRARAAADAGEFDRAEALYRTAATQASVPAAAQQILVELAVRLVGVGNGEGAVSAFREAGAHQPGHPAFGTFVRALLRLKNFPLVRELVDSLERTDSVEGEPPFSVPLVALQAAAELAWRQEDYPAAAGYALAALKQLRAQAGTIPVHTLIMAAHAAARAGDAPSAEPLLREAVALPDLTAEDRMRIANIYVLLRNYEVAAKVAFSAFRESPSDGRMVANFITVMMSPSMNRDTNSGTGAASAGDENGDASASGSSQPAEEQARSADDVEDGNPDDDVGTDGQEGVVAPDTFVRLVAEDGQHSEYLIFGEPPVDARLGEYLVTDRVVSDLIGRRVGDTVFRNPELWTGQSVRIERVLPAALYLLRRSIRTFNAHFPELPMFRVFRIGTNPTLESFGPMMAALRDGTEQRHRVLKQYDETPVPLGIVTKALGVSLIDLALGLAADPARTLMTEGPPYLEYSNSVLSAAAATRVVLTRPALEFMHRLNLLDRLQDRAVLIVPKAMLDEWDDELHELETTARSGRMTLREAGIRPALDIVAPGAAAADAGHSRVLRDRIMAAATVVLRPLSAMSEDDDLWRERFGPPSFDAMVIARAEGASLYADDLGLRAINKQQYDSPSFSTIALVEALHVAGAIDSDRFEGCVVQLIEWGHAVVPIRASTILFAIRNAKQSSLIRKVVGLLASAQVDATSAAIVAANALRGVAISSITGTTLEELTEHCLEALLRHRQPDEVVPQFLMAVRGAFALLPQHRKIVELATRGALARSQAIRRPSRVVS